jgi:hypothetical protein
MLYWLIYWKNRRKKNVDSEVESKEYVPSQIGFVLLLKEQKLLLNEAQFPTVRVAKSETMLCFIKTFESNFDKTISLHQIKKKINDQGVYSSISSDKWRMRHLSILVQILVFVFLNFVCDNSLSKTMQVHVGCINGVRLYKSYAQ